MVAGLGAQDPAADVGPIKIGLLLDSLENERWHHDRNLFVARVEELHAKVEVRDGGGDHAKQLEAAGQLLDAGVKALVVVPHDLEKAKEIVALAVERKVPVISYDRLIRDADVALYVSFDNVKVGRMQAEALLAAAPRGNYVLLGGCAHRQQRQAGARRPAGSAEAGDCQRRREDRRPSPSC